MTIAEALERADELDPNQYSPEQKMRWLSQLDGQIFEELIRTHADPVRESFAPYTDSADVLIAPFPYDELYVLYLQAKIAEENTEAGKYEQKRILYNEMLEAYCGWYSRQHRPKGGTRFWF